MVLDRSSAIRPSALSMIAARTLVATALAFAISGCAPAALTSARSQISAANYPVARQELVALSARSDLTASQRREVMDDLCLCDFKIGRPTYTLAEQRAACLDASKQPDSQSDTIIAQIDEAESRREAQEVEAALAAHDLADAERAATEFQSVPGADPVLVARWSKQIWTLADAQVFADSAAKKHRLGAAISAVRKNHPNVEKMDQSRFIRWVTETATVSGTPLAASVDLKDSTLRLSIDQANLQLA